MSKTHYAILHNIVQRAREAGIHLAYEALRDAKVHESPIAHLSTRELQVMIAIGMGIPPAEASARINVAAKTFSTYRARVLEKLKLNSNAELAILAFELKLVPSVLERYNETEDADEHVARNGQ